MVLEVARKPRSARLDSFAGNEKGVAYQLEQARALLKNADVVTNDAALWKDTVAYKSRAQLSPGERSLMQRIKDQLDPFGTLPDIFAAD